MKLQTTSRNFAAQAAFTNRFEGCKLNPLRNSARALLAMGSLSIALLATTSSVHGQTYDLAADWSDTHNPNGAWTYGRMDGSLVAARASPSPC